MSWGKEYRRKAVAFVAREEEDLDAWLDANAGRCERLKARITPTECERLRGDNQDQKVVVNMTTKLTIPGSCEGCEGVGEIMGKRAECTECGREMTIHSRGLCHRCYDAAKKKEDLAAFEASFLSKPGDIAVEEGERLVTGIFGGGVDRPITESDAAASPDVDFLANDCGIPSLATIPTLKTKAMPSATITLIFDGERDFALLDCIDSLAKKERRDTDQQIMVILETFLTER